MKIRRHSKNYNFIGDTISGVTFRWGKTAKENPLYAPWPELVDISISNHCTKGCNFCYRNSTPNFKFMSLKNYRNILQQLNHPKWGNVFQVAIGGGEPLEHPDFLEIINETLEYNIVPNFTTNGENLTNGLIKKLKEKIGAIAISTNDLNSINSNLISKLKINNIKCNIHYVLDGQNIKQAINILAGKYNSALKNINSIIFLTYKPLGRATKDYILKLNNDFSIFVNLIDETQCASRIGFDACFVPMLMHYTNVDINYVDPCECAFFSVYIDENLMMSPCSFTNDSSYTYSIEKYSIEHIWSKLFRNYRDSIFNDCVSNCKNKNECRGRCPYFEHLTLCHKVR